MQFNPGDGSGIVDEINTICATNNVDYPIADKTRRVNFALDQFYSIAQAYDLSWHFEDNNNYENDGVTERGLPIATCDLRIGQQDYPFALELLTVKGGVFAKDTQGVFHELEEETDPKNTFLLPAGRGVPKKYKVMGNSLFLDKITDYDSDEGLKIGFGRTAVKFLVTDTTRELRLPILFHEWICQVASLPFLIVNRLPNKNDIAAQIQVKKDPKNMDSIPYFMANRNHSKQRRLVGNKQNNR